MAKMQRIGSWAWAALVLAGCERVDLGVVVSAGEVGCNDFTCENSPELLYRGFRGLRKSGEPNEQGMWIYSEEGRPQLYDRYGSGWDLDVVNNRIIGRYGHFELSGEDLKGAEIIIEQDNQPPFVIHIDAVRTIEFPFGTPEQLDAYTLSWHHEGDPPAPFSSERRLCNAMPFPETDETDENADQLLGLRSEETVVFAGDYYDIERMTTTCDDDWINFGCAGQTLAKLLLTRNTCGSQESPDGADEEQLARERQATLKLLVADYCGTGAHNTVSRQPLVWAGGFVGLAHVPTSLEARWDENGAICVERPRLVENPPPPGSGFPTSTSGIWSLIEEGCDGHRPPECDNDDPKDIDGALRLSSNRAP
jgi:hypothetical protein